MKKCKQLLWLVPLLVSMLLSQAQSNTPPTAFAQYLTCTQGFPLAITLTASDPDGDPLTYRIVGPPVFGSVTGTPPSVVYFAPTNVFSGVLTDNFVFVANDGQVDSEFAAIQISVIPTNPVVTVLASDAEAAEPPPNNTGTFTFTRTGDLGSELTVLFRVAGTAVLNTDYQTSPPLATGTNSTIYFRTIPAGSNSATLTVIPLADTNVEPTETVILRLLTNSVYTLGTPSSATVNILDNTNSPPPPPVLNLVTTDPVAFELTASGGIDTASFTVTRTGASNSVRIPIIVSGTAVYGVDYYTVPAFVVGTNTTFFDLGSNQTSLVFTLYPYQDNVAEGTETAIFRLGTNVGYTLGPSNQSVISILDGPAPPQLAGVFFPPDGAVFASPEAITIKAGATNALELRVYADDQLLAATNPLVVQGFGSLLLLSIPTNFPPGQHTVYAVGTNRVGLVSNTYTSPPVHFRVLAPLAQPITPSIAVAPEAMASYALDSNGALFDWGSDYYGQLGDGSPIPNPSNNVVVPQQIPLPDGTNRWIKVAGGALHALALDSSGRLYSAGEPGLGQLGRENTVNSSTFLPIPFSTNVVGWKDIAAGNLHSLGLATGGQLFAWGNNSSGQLGIGSRTNAFHPQLVPFPAGVTAWTAIGAGSNYSIALGNNGQLYTCGLGLFGTLGTGGMTNSANFVPVTLPASVTNWLRFSPGAQHVLAISGSGALYAWGLGSLGQLGDGGFGVSLVPVPVTAPSGVFNWLALAAGLNHSLGIAADGNLYSWGNNIFGQLGPGPIARPVPTLVPPPGGVASWKGVGAGVNHSLAVSDGCVLFSWGANNFGQLGLGSFVNQTNEMPVQNLNNDFCAGPTNQQPFAFSQFLLATQQSVLSITLSASDPDNDPLTYRIVTPPSLGFLTGAPPNILYISTTNFSTTVTDAFTFVANDGYTDSLPATVTLLLFPPGESTNTLPVVWITSTDTQASEFPNPDGTTNTANFTIHRSGLTNDSLQVLLGISGTANDNDYFTLPPLYGSSTSSVVTVSLPPGSPSVPFSLYGERRFLSNSPATAIFTLLTNSSYTVAFPDNQVTISIINSSQPARIFFPPDGSLFASPLDIELRIACTNVSSLKVYADSDLLASTSAPPGSATFIFNLVTNFSAGSHTIYSVADSITSAPVHLFVQNTNSFHSPLLGIMPVANSSFVIDANGALFDWGFDGFANLGDGGVSNTFLFAGVTLPIQIPLPASGAAWAKVASGGQHTLALDSLGNVYATGDNSFGQTGVGSSSSTFTNVLLSVARIVRCKDVAAGDWHSLALATDGQIYAWGDNEFGQLGNGTTTNASLPRPVSFPPGVTSWTAVAAGDYHSLALGNDGNAYAWGYAEFGALGNGAVTNASFPQRVVLPAGVTNWLKLAAGGYHNLALAGNGKLYAWGYGGVGTLGYGGVTNVSIPVPVNAPSNVVNWAAISAGILHSLALAEDGSVYGWGNNSFGQLGPNASSLQLVPFLITPPAGVQSWQQISAGAFHTLAISDNCMAYSWGSNSLGQLGVGSQINQTNEVPVQGLNSLCSVFTNQAPIAISQSLIATQRTVVPITLFASDPDGDPLTYRIVTPPSLGYLTGAPPSILYISTTNFLTTVTDIFTFVANDGFTDSLLATVSIALLPANQSSNTLPIVTITSTDTEASEFPNFDGTTNAANFTISRSGLTNAPLDVLLRVTGTANYGFDYYSLPSLNLSSNSNETFVSIPAGSPSVPFTLYGNHHNLPNSPATAILALRTNGAYSLGSSNQVTIFIINSNQPPSGRTRVFFPPDGSVFASPLDIELRVANTNVTTLKLYADGNLLASTTAPPASATFVFNVVTNFSAGSHTAYSVANNSFTSAPVHFLVLSTNALNPSAPSLGAMPTATSSFVVDANGAVFAWGDDRYGNLGDGGLTNIGAGVSLPIQIPLPRRAGSVERWAKVSAGAQHTLLLSSSGLPYVTGGNSFGQTGVGTNITMVTNILLNPALNIRCKDIAAGGQHSLALTIDGHIYAWGFNAFGQLGLGTSNNAPLPQQVPFPPEVTNWMAIAAGNSHSLALDNAGNLYTWGSGVDGILGTGGTTNSSRPIKALLPAGVSFWTKICAGSTHNMALANNGKLYAWGAGFAGQLGIGFAGDSYVPVPVNVPAGVSTWLALTAGLEHSLAIADNGKLYAWGTGIAGIGTSVPFLYIPTLVPNPDGVASWESISAGFSHSLALGDNCMLYAAGFNNFGQLGNGTFIQHTNLQPVRNLDLCEGIFVTETNHAPTFVKGPDITVPENSGIQVITNWATQINPGAPSETNQILTFIVTNDNPHLFSTQPGIVPSGNLFFAGAPNSNGIAHVTVVLKDNGGNANGGQDTSAPQSFTITITPPNHPPVPIVRVFPSFVLSSNSLVFQVISPNNSNALVYFDASLSFDVDHDPLTFAWFKDGTNNQFGSSVVATNVLNIGTNSITLALSDGHVTVFDPFEVDVISAGDAVGELIALIQSLASQSGPRPNTWKQLTDPLRAAESEFDKGLWNAALVHLRIFQQRVAAQIQPSNPTLAAYLENIAEQIIDAIQSNTGAIPTIGTLQARGSDRKSLSFKGGPGQIYLVQASSDLIHWDTIGIASETTAGTFQFDDANSGAASARFYRLVAP